MFNFTSVKVFFISLLTIVSKLQNVILYLGKTVHVTLTTIAKSFVLSPVYSKNNTPLNQKNMTGLKFFNESRNIFQNLNYTGTGIQLPTQLILYIYRSLSIEKLQLIFVRFFGVGIFYLSYSCFIMYIDACLTDDEPL